MKTKVKALSELRVFRVFLYVKFKDNSRFKDFIVKIIDKEIELIVYENNPTGSILSAEYITQYTHENNLFVNIRYDNEAKQCIYVIYPKDYD